MRKRLGVSPHVLVAMLRDEAMKVAQFAVLPFDGAEKGLLWRLYTLQTMSRYSRLIPLEISHVEAVKISVP